MNSTDKTKQEIKEENKKDDQITWKSLELLKRVRFVIYFVHCGFVSLGFVNVCNYGLQRASMLTINLDALQGLTNGL